jgi:antitoxin CptB
MTETAEARLKRMGMRSWRRGTKEMDLILGPYADAHLGTMPEAQLVLYDALLDASDQDLLPMMMGQMAAPDGLSDLVAEISLFAKTRLMATNSSKNLV